MKQVLYISHKQITLASYLIKWHQIIYYAYVLYNILSGKIVQGGIAFPIVLVHRGVTNTYIKLKRKNHRVGCKVLHEWDVRVHMVVQRTASNASLITPESRITLGIASCDDPRRATKEATLPPSHGRDRQSLSKPQINNMQMALAPSFAKRCHLDTKLLVQFFIYFLFCYYS